MNVSVPMVSRTLRYLQEKGWIERSVDENDRRSVLVTVTPSGSEILQENIGRIVQVLNKIMSVFSDEEIRTIAKLYGKFADSMEQQFGKPDK